LSFSYSVIINVFTPFTLLFTMSLNHVLDRPVERLSYIEASLNYLVPMAEKPVSYQYEPPAGVPRHNGVYESHLLPIYNARPIVQDLVLDRQGFALLNHSSLVQNFYDDEQVRQVYYPEAERLLAEYTGAFQVVVFDHNVRNLQRVQQSDYVKEPVKRVHNDFTAKSGYSRARAELAARGSNLDQLLQRRFSIINAWRPIAEPVQQSPLAVCDARSIAPADLVAGDLVYRNRVGETYAVIYNQAHRWFYFPQMRRDEVLLIKCFDSAEAGQARFAAHTAFDDPTSPLDAPPRESIELRILVFYS
jgi:hypothetical protein